MHLPSRCRDDSPTVSPASKFVASTFATIFLDDLNFDGHASISQREFPFSVKSHYLGKVVDFIQVVIVDRQESCNPVLLNSFYAHGVIKLILITFEATSQLLWTILQTPVSMETYGANSDESEKTWIFGTLVIYAGLIDHLATPSCVFRSSSSHFLVHPVANGTIFSSKIFFSSFSFEGLAVNVMHSK
jgi:E3 ubiquitin-protein ligase HUWE1